MQVEKADGDDGLLVFTDGDTPPELAGAPSPRAIGFVIAALILLIGGFVFGRQTAARPVVAPTPTPTMAATLTSTPSLPAPPVVQVAPGRLPAPPAAAMASLLPPVLVADMLGPGRVVAGLGLGFGNQALVFCRVTAEGSALEPKLLVAHAGSRDGRNYLISLTEIGTPSTDADACERCAPEVVTLADVQVLVGSCGSSGARTAYVIAANPQFLASPVALKIRCGGAQLDEVTGSLMLTAPDSVNVERLLEPVLRAPIMIERSEGAFVADDLELLRATCDIAGSAQLVGGDTARPAGAESLTYDAVDSALGRIGVHRTSLVALDASQCDALTTAWSKALEPPVEAGDAPLARVSGLDAPEGVDDWYLVCLGEPG